MPRYFPCFTDIENAPVLIFGGDAHAAKKAERLLPYAPHITVWAPVFGDALQKLREDGKIHTVCRDFAEFEAAFDAVHPRLVLVCELGESTELYERIFVACRARGIEINTEDKQQYCTFIFPSLIQRGTLTVAISTGGASPAVAKKLREEIEQTLPDATDEILDWLFAIRPTVQGDATLPRGARAALWRALADAAFSAKRPLTEAEAAVIIAKYRT